MAQGKSIVLNTDQQGVFLEGTAGEIVSPGMLLGIEAATEPIGGRLTYEMATLGANGVRSTPIICDIDHLQGKINTDAYAADSRVFGYVPAPGEEVNVLVKASAGALAIGDLLIAEDGTGLWIKTTGTPESEPFVVMETSGDVAANRLVHVMATGQ